jgi:hypothetical protein
MIQRIQTLWLLLAALVNAGLFVFAQYKADIMQNGVAVTQYIRVNDHYPSLLVALVITALPMFAIFMYKNRTKQRNLALVSLVATVGFIATTLMRVRNFNNGTSAPVNGTYWIGSVLPVISVIFLFMAISGIRKDEKLVKSLDRLR